MSSGQSTPVPAPTPAAQFDWAKLVAVALSLVCTWLGTLHFGSSPTPTPSPKPEPNGGGGQVVPQPVPPGPSPQPSPLPPAPSPLLTITNEAGQPLALPLEPGIGFVVQATDGKSALTPIPSHAADANLGQINDSKYWGVLRNGCSVNVVVSGQGRPQIAVITCKAAQPPPVPVDPPNPQPKPQPTAKNISVAIIEDSSQGRTPETVAMIQSKAWDRLHAAGVPYKWYDKSDTVATAQRCVSMLSSSNVSVSKTTVGYVIYDQDSKQPLKSGQLSSVEDLIANVNAITGRGI